MAFHPIYEIEIKASVEKVWDLLAGFDEYPSWNSMISFEEAPAVGKRVPMRVEIMGRKIVTPVTFLRIDINKELAWVGGPKGLFTGEHYFKLEATGDNECRLIQGEKFRGLMLPLMWPFLKKTLNTLYTQSNEDIVKAVEKA
jgi:hypothetical protein